MLFRSLSWPPVHGAASYLVERSPDPVTENSWVQVMLGQGIVPRSWHPIATNLQDSEMTQLFDTIRSTIDRTLASLPSHADYVASYCGAGRAPAANAA